jgi:hypothetical protein
MNPITGKVQRRGTFDGYEVAGWRHSDDPSWKVKVWLAGCPRDWFGYTVTAGMFELKMYAHAQREAVLHAIGEWEAELMDLSSEMHPFAEPSQYLRYVTLNDDRGGSGHNLNLFLGLHGHAIAPGCP